MNRWKEKISTQLEELDVLFENDCTHQEAISAWREFFNHPYWSELDRSIVEKSVSLESYGYENTEQFIENLYPVAEIYQVEIDCRVSTAGFREMPIYEYLEKHLRGFSKFIPFNFKVKCKVGNTNCPSYDKVLWKVRNVGEVAERKNCIRGQIKQRTNEIIEPTAYEGTHYIECYLIKNDVCVAIGHINVPIGRG